MLKVSEYKLNFSNFIYALLLIISDIFFLLVSLHFAWQVYSSFHSEDSLFENLLLVKYYWIIFIVIIVALFESIYSIRYDFWSDTKRVIKSLFIAFIATLIVILLSKVSYEYSIIFIMIFFIISSFLIPIFKRFVKKFLFHFDIFKINVKIVADPSQLITLEKEIQENWYFGFKICEHEKYDMVLISSKNFDIGDLQNVIKQYSKEIKDVYVVPYLEYLDFSDISVVNYFNIQLSAIHLENKLLNKTNIFLKYIFEKLMVLIIFPFALVLHIFLAFLIQRDSNGSIIFKQKRMGINKKIFNCYKYRTMYEGSDKLLTEYLNEHPDEVEYYKIYHKYKNDPRITKVGKFLRASSLDEFPQFYNILRGDMNLIGPRPYMLNESNKIGIDNEEIILKVRPGLTGFWQVSGRNKLTFQERVELDIWYIQNWSLWIDFVIFLKTIKVVLSKIGAK